MAGMRQLVGWKAPWLGWPERGPLLDLIPNSTGGLQKPSGDDWSREGATLLPW